MDDSFTSWRNKDKHSANHKNQRVSLVISDSDDDDLASSNAIDVRSKFIIESSDDDENTNSFANSRSSAGVTGNRRSGQHWTVGANHQSVSDDNSFKISSRIDELDDSTSTTDEMPVVQKRRNRKRMIFDDTVADLTNQSEELNEQSLTIYDASDVNDISEITDHSDAEDLTSTSEESIEDLTSKPEESIEHCESRHEESIDLTSRSDESDEDLASRSNKSDEDLASRREENIDLASRSNESDEDLAFRSDESNEDLKSRREKSIDLASRSNESDEDLASRSNESDEDLASRREENIDLASRSNESNEDLAFRSDESNEDLKFRREESIDLASRREKAMHLSGNQGNQSPVAFISSEASETSDRFKNMDDSPQKDEFRSNKINNSASYPEAKENKIVMPPACGKIDFDSVDEPTEQSKHSLSVFDITDTEQDSKSIDSVCYVDSSSETSSSSHSKSVSALEDHAVVMSLVKKEIGVSNVDPYIAQKRAILTCNIEQVQSQLKKSKMLFNTANINMLPDKGEKLRRSIDTQEAKLLELSIELDSLPKTINSQPLKPLGMSQAVNRIAPPSWEDLPAPMAIKPLGRKALETHEREEALTVDRLEDLHKSLNARPRDDERALDPKGLKVGLMPHQQHALAWLLWREKQKPRGGILADDMGLGKTLTMISLIMATMVSQDLDDESEDSDEEPTYRRGIVRPKGGTLVVCPASLLTQWEGEVNKRVRRGMLSVELYHGTTRETVARRLAKNDIVITTYNLIGREYKVESSPLYKIKWKRVILDEAHIIRNHKSLASEAASKFHAKSRWALTGTPIQNKELDLYALLKFLKCSPFDDLRVWKRWVDNKNAAGQQRLATVMKTLMLRRTKQELQAQGGLQALPDKNLEEIDIKLDTDEQLVYEKVLVFSRTLFAQFLHQRAEKDHMVELNAGRFDAPTFLQKPKTTQFNKVQNQLLARHADVKLHEILVLLLRLRQVCCHPALIHKMLDQEDLQGNDIDYDANDSFDILTELGDLKLDDDENINPNEVGVDKRVVKNLLTRKNPVFEPKRQSSKMRAVLNTIQEILDKGDKMVVVSQWTSMLEVVQSHLQALKGATFVTLSGKVPVKKRQEVVESFNQTGTGPRILLLSLTAGGVGLNLVGGNHLLLLDIHWNPQLEAQAQDRIYRVGQTKSVYIYKFMCTDTIEQRIKKLQDHKLSIAQGVLTGAGTAGGSKLSLDDLKSLFSL